MHHKSHRKPVNCFQILFLSKDIFPVRTEFYYVRYMLAL